MDEKIAELAIKHNIPLELLKEVLSLEKDKVHLTTRRILREKIIELIKKHKWD